jgi:cellobiose-specific phosphotransferase system component IIB
MGRAKEIIVKVIPASIANDFVRKNHYSKSVVQNSVLHFGAFLDGNLHGVMQYGNPIDKRNVLGFVETGQTENQKWNSMLELNRMAFDDYLPKNSESRCISISIKLIKKQAPQIKWILSFADGTQCGDGTIYRASGFYLVGINKNSTIYKLLNGKTKAKHGTSKENFEGATKLIGYQLRYIYLIDKTAKLNLPIIPFQKIDDADAGMYKGEKITMQQRKVNMDQSV